MNLSSVRVAGQGTLSLFYAKSRRVHKNELGKSWVSITVVQAGLSTAFVRKPHSRYPSAPLWSFKHQGIKGPEIGNISFLQHHSLQGSMEKFQKKNLYYQYTCYKKHEVSIRGKINLGPSGTPKKIAK